jgi:hypothetical protein
VLFDPQGEPTILDWDCVGYGWRAYDLTVLLWSTALQGLGTGLWDAYLRGYQEQRRLSGPELAAVPAFVAVRHIWVMGVEMGHVLDGTWGVGRVGDRWLDRHLATLGGWLDEEYRLVVPAVPDEDHRRRVRREIKRFNDRRCPIHKSILSSHFSSLFLTC